MNSFREKLGLLLAAEPSSTTPYSDSTTCVTAAAMDDEAIELLIGSNGHGTIPVPLDGLKKRSDTADTEMSFPLQNVTKEEELRLEDIGSHDDDDCFIYCADSSLSLSDDKDDTKVLATVGILPPLDTDSVFAEADSMLRISSSSTSTKVHQTGKQKKRPRNSNKLKGFFSSGRLVHIGRNKSHSSFSRNQNKNQPTMTTATTSAARSRKFFSVSQVPASIAEEPCNTPSSTSASVASTP